MLTSPTWYVAICCAPTLFFGVCAVVAALCPLGRAVVVATAVGRITTISTVLLFGYGLWQFGVFTGLGIIVISIPCAVLIDRCIGKLANGIIQRRVADFRQAIIHTILDKAGVVDLEAMAEMVEELESFDDEALRDIADDVFDSEAPADALLMNIVAPRLNLMPQADNDDSAADAAEARLRSGKRSRLLVDFEILDEDGRHIISSRSHARTKTRRRRKAKSKAAAKLARPHSENPGNRA